MGLSIKAIKIDITYLRNGGGGLGRNFPDRHRLKEIPEEGGLRDKVIELLEKASEGKIN